MEEIFSYLPKAKGGDKSIFKIDTDLSAEEVLSKLQTTFRQMPASLLLVKFITIDEEKEKMLFKIKREGKNLTERLNAYDILFGADCWENEVCFSPLLTVIKEGPEEDEVFIILNNHPKDLYNVVNSLLQKAGFSNAELQIDESFIDRFIKE